MKPRLHYAKHAPGVYEAMDALDRYLGAASVDEKLLHLVRLRASQLNGCAYCIDMHWKDLRAAGESEQRLYGLDAWRESPYYTAKERAALEWTEAVTLISQTHADDAIYDRVREHFNEKELSDLTVAVAIINSWNRVAIASRTVAGKYQPPAHK